MVHSVFYLIYVIYEKAMCNSIGFVGADLVISFASVSWHGHHYNCAKSIICFLALIFIF